MTIDYTAQLRANGDLMAAGAARDMDAHVPTCPEWNVGKLVVHTGKHHRWVANAVRGLGEPPARPENPGLRGDELLAWFREGYLELADLLDQTGDDVAAWTWSAEQNVGFWRRRTSLETLVHRWDAENATGSTTPMDPELASDCADEMFFVFVQRAGADAIYKGPDCVATMEAADHGAAWTIRLVDGQIPIIERGASDGVDATLRAKAEELGLMLWGRLGPEVLEVEGDDSAGIALTTWIRQ